MKRRAVRIAIGVTVLVALQVGLYMVYRVVERSRAPARPHATFAAERLRGTELAPPLAATGATGAPTTLTWPAAPIRVVHFWATWCKPCRTELPGLLALARDLRSRGIELIAVAVDDDWRDIRAFFGGDVPPEVVVSDDVDVHKRYGVSTLPDTYVVGRDGGLVARFHGARDWRTPAARDYLLGFAEGR